MKLKTGLRITALLLLVSCAGVHFLAASLPVRLTSSSTVPMPASGKVYVVNSSPSTISPSFAVTHAGQVSLVGCGSLAPGEVAAVAMVTLTNTATHERDAMVAAR